MSQCSFYFLKNPRRIFLFFHRRRRHRWLRVFVVFTRVIILRLRIFKLLSLFFFITERQNTEVGSLFIK